MQHLHFVDVLSLSVLKPTIILTPTGQIRLFLVNSR